MIKGRWKRAGETGIILLATAGICAAVTKTMPTPGTLSYVEGQVWIAGEKQTPQSVGSSFIRPGQALHTGNGKAELTLTPGARLRIGSDSTVKMVAHDLNDTEFRLEKGSAMVEVDRWFKKNDLHMVVGSATARMLKDGLYYFNASPPTAAVLSGKVRVVQGDQRLTLEEGHEVRLIVGKPLKAQRFEKEDLKSDPLFR